MKTKLFLLLFSFTISFPTFSQAPGKIVVRNASDTYPTFIASLNGVRVENTYAHSATFAWLDDNVFRLKVWQYGGTRPLAFAVNSEANYITRYMITKDETGAYRIALESKILASAETATLAPATPVVTLAPVTPTVILAPSVPEIISDKDYADMLAAVKKESFENSKLDIARSFFTAQHHNTEQVQGMVKLFSFEKNKLAFAKLAYAKTVDKQNYYKIYDAFSFSTSKQELSDFINKNP